MGLELLTLRLRIACSTEDPGTQTDETDTNTWMGGCPGTTGKRPTQQHSPAMLASMGHTRTQPEAPGTGRVLGQNAF